MPSGLIARSAAALRFVRTSPNSAAKTAIAQDIARWLDVPLELVCVDAARDSYSAITEGRVDLCFLANEPARERSITLL